MSQSNLALKKSSGSFLSTLFLRPYGNNLLTGGGKAVLTIMFIVMFIVAAVEGAAWGYSLGLSSPLFGVVIGFVFFLFMFSLDISLATTDLMEQKHKKDFSETEGLVSHQKKKSPYEKLRDFFGGFVSVFFKGVGSFVIRLLMAAISLWITSDFITHFLFRAEIDQKIQEKQNVVFEAKKAELERMRAQYLLDFDKKYKSIIDKRDEESKTGVGDRTKIFLDDLKELDSEKNNKIGEMDLRIKELAEAHKDNNVSGLKKEGIVIIADSQTARNDIILSIEKTESFQKTHRAVEILIAILAFGLIFIKLSQPDHLKLYYSSRLQELWRVYKEGRFDQYLPETHRSTIIVPKAGEDALPQQFEQIMYLYMQQKSEWDKLEAARLKQEQLKKHQELAEQSHQAQRLIHKQRQQEQDADELDDQQREQVKHQYQQELEQSLLARQQEQERAAIEHERQMQSIQAKIEHEAFVQQLQQKQRQIAVKKSEEDEKKRQQAEESYQVHLEKTVKERALHRDHTKGIEYRIQNLKAGLRHLDEFEEGHKTRYAKELFELNTQEEDKLKQLVSMQKEYQNQEKQLDNKRHSIEKEESELAHLRLLLETSKNGEDSHKSHVVQMVIYYGDAIRKKESLIYGKKQRLREFESRQAFFKEHCDKVSQELDSVRQKKQKITEPLDRIIEKRSLLERECIDVLSHAACVDSPYQPFSEAEIPYLVSQLERESVPAQQVLGIDYQPQ